jgi:nitrate/nitrite transport system substrate-binding protein
MLDKIKVGFSPLTDCAPLIVAKEEGFFAQEGLDVTLCKEVSWANIRDKLVYGEFDAAHMLAPMLIATTLGQSGIKKPLLTAYSFGLNGNAVSVSNVLFEAMLAYEPELIECPEKTASVLKQVIKVRKEQFKAKLRFAVVFPFSMHYYLLSHWLQTVGVDINEDVEVLVVPPSRVVQALEEEVIDGYCVGEPWNTHAVKRRVGVTIITGCEIWNNAPEKVLAVTEEWAKNNSDIHNRLIWALYQASRWIDHAENRPALISYLAMGEYVNAPVSSIESALSGQVCNPVYKTCRSVPNFSLPFKHQANFPWQSHAEWILQQMQAVGQISGDFDIKAVVAATYRTDLYRKILLAHGISVPSVNSKAEGEHVVPRVNERYLLGEDLIL